VSSSGAEEAIKKAFRTSTSSVHVDETGINIAGKRRWLHGVSDQEWTYFFPHKKEEKKR
jgi:transposase